MKSKKSSLKPLYERPGRLSADRNIPSAANECNDDLRIKVHYGGEDDIPDPVKGTVAEFTVGSLNALDPFEDEALLAGEIRPKNTGKVSGVESVHSQIFEAEADIDEEENTSLFSRDGHTFMVNSDLMAGGAEPVHAKSAYGAGKPTFFTDVKKLTISLIGLFALIVIEFIGLVLLLR